MILPLIRWIVAFQVYLPMLCPHGHYFPLIRRHLRQSRMGQPQCLFLNHSRSLVSLPIIAPNEEPRDVTVESSNLQVPVDSAGPLSFESVVQMTCTLLKNMLPKHWVAIQAQDGFHVVALCRESEIAIQRDVFVNFSGSVRITVHRKEVSQNLCDKIMKAGGDKVSLTEQTYKSYVDRIVKMTLFVRSFEMCAGADDLKCEIFWAGDSCGYVDNNPYGESRYTRTFRTFNCAFLVNVSKWRCSECYKAVKRQRERVKSHSSEEVDKSTRNDYLDNDQLQEKLNSERREKRNLKRQVDYLHDKIYRLIEEEGVNIDCDLAHDLTEVLGDSPLTVTQQLLIQQQHKYANRKGPSGMRWHPALLRFALLLKSTSSAAYLAVQNSGFIRLPSERTLFDYSHAMPQEEGVFHNRILSIGEKVQKFQEKHKKFHSLLFDEVHISQKLVYRKSDGNLVGYVKLNEAEAELKYLCDNLTSDTPKALEPSVATKILTYMVKGVTTSIKEVVAAFPTSSLCKEELFDHTWDVISYCEKSGVNILALVCDGSAVNRSFFEMHTPATLHERVIVCDTVNMCAPERKVYFISDAPHLLKTIRNCFAKSGTHKKCTRLLRKGGETIVWKTIENLFVEDVDFQLRKCYKLNEQNVYLNSFSCMKVSYAAQVMSRTVAIDLKDRAWPGTKETVDFIFKTNDFFDCINGAHTSQASKKANDRLAPYTAIYDDRFTELKEYESYILDWEKEVQNLPLSATQKAKRLLSKQTIDGICITINSFIGSVKYLLQEADAKFVNARVLCQDPLEQYFSKQRASGGGRHNPTVASFSVSDQQIALHRDLNVKRRSGNTECVHTGMSVSDDPLPKLKKSKM